MLNHKCNNNHDDILYCYDALDIRESLENHEPIVYSDNGNRAVNGEKFIKELESILPLVGITRIAQIGQLLEIPYYVFQATRPNIFSNAAVGQNTGSQGKGPTELQAKISCIMESIEGFCAEPKMVSMVRGKYNQLKHSNIIVHPELFLCNYIPYSPKLNAELMWTEAYSLKAQTKVLIPAQLVFFPVYYDDFKTSWFFPMTSNGLASGATILEATIHGLYELIERHYMALTQQKKAFLRELTIDENLGFDLLEYNQNASPEHRLHLKILSNQEFEIDLPMVYCSMGKFPNHIAGHGCSSSLSLSISRAISECFQSSATTISGAREDGTKYSKLITQKYLNGLKIEHTPIPYSKAKRKVVNRDFTTLNEELDFIKGWLQKQGFDQIFIANLTRKGINIPVVKVVVPGLLKPIDMRTPNNNKQTHLGSSLITKLNYPNLEGSL